MEFQKGHGTGNDFVVLPDPQGLLELTPELVARLCDRRFGIGGDGVLRVVRTSNTDQAPPQAQGPEFFMDYRNADGSAAAMCGNGARVFAQYLWDTGLAEAGPVRFGTRGGVRRAELLPDGRVQVEMGPAVLGEQESATVEAAGRSWPATPVHVPNPHAVVILDSLDEAGSLVEAPHLRPAAAFPEGANVEFVVGVKPGRIAMRVHERGVGETLSCGTGACAAAVVHLARSGQSAGRVLVDVPGGQLQVDVSQGLAVSLTGPVSTVAHGRVDPDWLAQAR